MIKYVVPIVAGIMTGLAIHLLVILLLPTLGDENNFNRFAAQLQSTDSMILSPPEAGEDNPLRLDPELAYYVCRLDLSKGAGAISGILPDSFWSVSVFDRHDRSAYATLHRAGTTQFLQLGVFNAAQTRQLATQDLEITDGLLIIEAPTNDVYVVVRLAIPFPEVRPRYERQLSALQCAHAPGG